MIGGGRPVLHENLVDTVPPADFLSIFARRDSAVTSNEEH